MASIFDRAAAGLGRLAHAWNVFTDSDSEQTRGGFNQYGQSYGLRPDRRRLSVSNDRSIINSIITRLGIDAASPDIRHVRMDENNRYSEDIDSYLNDCLVYEANIDQAARAFRQDIFTSMFEKGVVAIVPIDTSLNPKVTGAYDINTMRVGEIVAWYPRDIRVSIWNDRLGRRQEVTVSKTIAAIAENPLYSVMNEPNGTLQRLIRKLNILDAVDEASSSGKLDIIIQLPYVIKSEARKEQAEQRAKDIEMQLKGSKYGIAYTDGTEKITQLNRPAENNLLAQITYLTGQVYAQLGLTEGIFNGTADEKEMLNYHNRTIEPVLAAVVEAMRRTFLTKTARTQGQSIIYFRDPFKLVSVSDIAEIADKFSRNEILTPNEIRGIIGFKPNAEAKSDQLINSNMPQAAGSSGTPDTSNTPPTPPDTTAQDAIFNTAMSQVEEAIKGIASGA